MHLARRSLVSLPALLAVGALGAGCVGHAYGGSYVTTGYGGGAYVVAHAPPVSPATIYAVDAPPYEGAQWVEAHWEWRGSEYVWMSGYWIRPSAQYTFVQPRWEPRAGGYVYVGGGWTEPARSIVVRAGGADASDDEERDRGARGHRPRDREDDGRDQPRR